MRQYYSYTDDQLAIAVKESKSVTDTMRYLNIKLAGGSHAHISKRIKKLKLDTSHFVLPASKGTISSNRKTPSEIFVVRTEGAYREHSHLLRRAMIETGTAYKCSIPECSLSSWMGESINLHVDHIDGNYCNNTKENLRFLCPNCHSQTVNYCKKK